MKVLCSACEAAEARVLCCADEAALCARCDRDVHAANRLAGKHHRLPLLPPDAVASPPNCDICQDAHAYFFCVEDRALLCRSCDVAVHTANAFVSTHRRFLLTGVQVGLQPGPGADDPAPQPPTAANDDIDWAAGPDVAIAEGLLPDWSVVDEQFGAPAQRPAEPPLTNKTPSKRSPRRAPFAVQGGLAGGMPGWPLDEFFGFSEFNAGLCFTDNGTSKADSGKLGSTDGSPTGRSSSDWAQDFFGQVPEFHQWSVPELPSPPTASGLHWQSGGPGHGATDTDIAAVSVPDISSPENPFRCFATAAGQPQPAPATKRRRIS
ncbi:hypothetical protein BS78_03G025800 [Paspalum vaginatum]|nr:hypothetical protein BS78_03G025800 [Paspalum vaginatum]